MRVVTRSTISRVACTAIVLAVLAGIAGCRRRTADSEPPVASASLKISKAQVPLGSPIDLTYHFELLPTASKLAENYRVFVHVLDGDRELMWTDDHLPPTPTTTWQPGQPVEYTRTIFVPVYPYIGEATIDLGLYSTKTQHRLKLDGTDTGQRAYRVGKLELLPQTENIFLIFKDGWHPAEVSESNAAVEWQWTKKDAVLAFRNPKRDCVFYLDADGNPKAFREPQNVTLTIGDRVLATFPVASSEEFIKRVLIPRAVLGDADMVELHIQLDRTFVPALLRVNRDIRELGLRVFHAYVEAK